MGFLLRHIFTLNSLFLRQGLDKRTREYRVDWGDEIVWKGPASSFSKDEKDIIKIFNAAQKNGKRISSLCLFLYYIFVCFELFSCSTE
jgi:hypothetical protein